MWYLGCGRRIRFRHELARDLSWKTATIAIVHTALIRMAASDSLHSFYTIMKYIVAQLGARRHYAIPRMLHAAGILAHFFTDICAAKGWPSLLHRLPKALLPNALLRLLGRMPAEVPVDRITAFTAFGWEYARRRRMASSQSESVATHLWAGEEFCRRVVERGLGNSDGVYTFNSAGLELLVEARRCGLRSVMEQTIAPIEVESRLLRQERVAFPDWESSEEVSIDAFAQRQRAEWAHADLILCGSDFVRDAIGACGGPAERCSVVPYGVDTHFCIAKRESHNGPLRVLTVGAVGLRKGSPYVLETARKLAGRARFRMVGSIAVSSAAQTLLSRHVELTGPVPRTEVLEHFRWADVFLLPSVCEGSATVVYEALATGLPVVCTPNTGSVVRDGVEGFVVPVRNSDAVVDRISVLGSKPVLLREMSEAARERSRSFTLSAYQQRLTHALLSQNKGTL